MEENLILIALKTRKMLKRYVYFQVHCLYVSLYNGQTSLLTVLLGTTELIVLTKTVDSILCWLSRVMWALILERHVAAEIFKAVRTTNEKLFAIIV